jgi:hypothetical protein
LPNVALKPVAGDQTNVAALLTTPKVTALPTQMFAELGLLIIDTVHGCEFAIKQNASRINILKIIFTIVHFKVNEK